MAVRSQRLALATYTIPPATTQVLYVVPADRVTILRSVRLTNRGGATATLEERIVVSGVTDGGPSLSIASLAANVSEIWRVLEAGDSFGIRNMGAANVSIAVWISGAELVVA